MARRLKKDNFEGCLVALALGDSLGATMEGYRSHDLLVAYQEERYDRWQMQVALWTDDTAMTVATAQSVIACAGVNGEDIARRYLAWYRTGGRGIGRATLRSMERLLNRVPWDEAGETGLWSAGSGVAMRIAPIGLFHAPNLRNLPDDVHDCGIITHRSDEAVNAAIAVAWVIARAAVGELRLDSMIANLLAYVPPCKAMDSIVRAQELAADGVPPTKALPDLGLSGSAWETVASAFYCWLRNPEDLADVLTVAVLGAGDADTRAAVAGSMAGAYLGSQAIPQRWARRLDGYRALVNLSHRLYETTLEAWHVKGD